MSARHQIELTRAARRALATKVQKQIDRHILALAKNAYPPGSKSYGVQRAFTASEWGTTASSTS